MEGGAATLKEITPNFFEHVFKFDESNKNEFTNMLQYTLLAIIPVIIILKSVKHMFPEEDEAKGTLEILVESVGQIIFIVSMFWFCDKIIRYVPTYSKTDYPNFTPITFMLPFLLILTTLQTKLGGKIEILVDRLMDAWHGRTNEPPPKKHQAQQHQAQQQQHSQHQPSQADHLDTSQILPQNRQLTSLPQTQSAMDQRDFNSMYQDTTTPLQHTDFPAGEPMAANDIGGAFSGW